MAVWSSLKNIGKLSSIGNRIVSLKNVSKIKAGIYVPIRASHEQTLPIRTSTYFFFKAKNLMHFYLIIGIVPLAVLAAYVNIFIGPAELALIPEGYEPHHWEYYENPITRFMARYFVPSFQENHERYLHSLFIASEKHKILVLRKEIKQKIKERGDYQSWYYEKAPTQYLRYTGLDAKKRNDVSTSMGILKD